MTYISAALRRLVIERASEKCEYCRIHQDDSLYPHEVDHIIAVKHGGVSTEANLCLSCSICNRNKGSDLASWDAETETRVFLFHPRMDNWDEHFRLENGRIMASTPVGQVTANLLQFNTPARIASRVLLVAQGRYP